MLLDAFQSALTLHALRRKPGMRARHLQALVAGLTLTLCGCASLEPRESSVSEVDVPAAWSSNDVDAANGTSSQMQWWLRFDDPLLASLVTQALQANSSVRSARAALRQARALHDVAAAGLLPSVGATASGQHSTVGGQRSDNRFQAGLDASWELDIFGANRSALGASEAAMRASAASLGDVRRSIAAEVGLNYIALRAFQTRLAIADDNLAGQRETLQITLWREQAGLVTSLESEQARATAEQTSALLPALQTSIEQTRHAIAVLTGRPPAALSIALASAGPVPLAADNLALSIPAETLRQRPDVRGAEQQVVAAVARVAQADAARLPNFRLSGSLGLNALSLGALTNGASIVSALMAGVTMPVFDGGAARAQLRAQQAALDQSREAYRAIVLTALKDVEDALVGLQGDRQRLARLQRAAQAAANASQLARQRYSSGLVDFQTVLDTQRTQFGTRDGVASASAELASDHVRLYKALGGGWRPDGGAPAALPTADLPGTSPS